MTSGKGGEGSPAPTSQSASPSNTSTEGKPRQPRPAWRRAISTLNWMPPWCRWTPGQPPAFSLAMNLLFAFAGAMTVANLYYNHPILNILAQDFNVSNETVSRVPTLMQAGYAVGLLFLCPLGDLFKRRPFVLLLVFVTASMWIGLCTTKSFVAFEVISFITAVTTVTPQLMLPLVGELAPPRRRATALSIVVSGNMMGLLIARLLSGVVTNYTSWRNIYWLALGLQYTIFILLWLFMPDYPSTNPGGLNYFKMLWSIVVMLRKHPVLVQAGLIGMLTSAPFTSYWTTLTFLLSGPDYNYSSLTIGLFALIGIVGMFLSPVYARTFIDRFVPTLSVIIGGFISLLGIVIGTYTGTRTVAGPIIQALFIDAGMQITQIANRSSIYAIEPTGRNRVNTAFMLLTFVGQIMGTAAGNQLYNEHGGWIASGSLSVGFVILGMTICLARGPWEEGWIGWSGGFSMRKKNKNTADGKTVERPQPLARAWTNVTLDGDVERHAKADIGNVEAALGEMEGDAREHPVREMNDLRERQEEKDVEHSVLNNSA